MKLSDSQLRLYFVMGSQDCKGRNPLDILQQAIRGGITCFQFREKGSSLTTDEALQLGWTLRNECRKQQVPFIVDDRVDMALALEADGVHVGEEDVTLREVKNIVPSNMIVGASAHTTAAAQDAVAKGADYLGIGPVFSTTSKTNAKSSIGIDGISTFYSQIHGTVPVVAIGGIHQKNAADVAASGVGGIAVISAIAGAADPAQAAAKLWQWL